MRRAIEEQGAAAQVSAADLANATLSAQSALALAYVQLRETDSLYDLLVDTVRQYQRSLDITQNQYNAGTAAKSDVITAQALVLAAQASEINTGVARQQNEHAIAVLIGRPPAELSIAHAPLAQGIPGDSGQPAVDACWSAGPTSPRPSGRCRRKTPPSASRSGAIIPTSRFPAPSAISGTPS